MTARDSTLLGWAMIAVLVLAAEVAVVRGGLASLRAVCSSFVGPGATRLFAVIGWMWLGWHLFAR